MSAQQNWWKLQSSTHSILSGPDGDTLAGKKKRKNGVYAGCLENPNSEY